MTSKKRCKNRNPVKQWFLTFPKSPVTKHAFRDSLLPLNLEFYHIVEESHQDKSKHLHACVKFVGGLSLAYLLRHFKGVYPESYKRIDFQPVRSMKHALAYLSKEDTAPLFNKNWVPNRGQDMSIINKRRKIINRLLKFEENIFGYIEKQKLNYYVQNKLPIPDPLPTLTEFVNIAYLKIPQKPSH